MSIWMAFIGKRINSAMGHFTTAALTSDPSLPAQAESLIYHEWSMSIILQNTIDCLDCRYKNEYKHINNGSISARLWNSEFFAFS